MSENFWCPVHGALVLNVETELADTAAIFQSVVAISSFVSLTKGDLVAEHQDFHYLGGHLASLHWQKQTFAFPFYSDSIKRVIYQRQIRSGPFTEMAETILQIRSGLFTETAETILPVLQYHSPSERFIHECGHFPLATHL
jgi:hypothetical protein